MGALVWLASYPKSGNTWMRSFLHNLLRNTKEPADINKLDRFCLGESAAGFYLPHLGKPLSDATPEEIAAVRAKAHRDMTKAFPDSVFVKTHNYLGEWLGCPLHNMGVTAGAIYIVRNPLDVALSMMPHFDLTIEDAIGRLSNQGAVTAATETHVPEVHSSWSMHVKSWTAQKNPNLHVVRYEDLLGNPVKEFGKVTRFLGLNPPKERLFRAIRNSSFKALKAQEAKSDFKERSQFAKAFFREGKKDQWKEKLSEEQVARIVADHREQMERFKYIPKGY